MSRYEFTVTVESDKHLVGTDRGQQVSERIYAAGFWKRLNRLRGVTPISLSVTRLDPPAVQTEG